MKWVVLTIFVVVVLLAVGAMSSCTMVAKFQYECEGKCKGQLGRDLEMVYPDEQLTQPKKEKP